MANTDKKTADDEKKAGAGDGADTGDDKGKKADPAKGDDDKAADPPAKKVEKTFTKAELDAAKQQAAADAVKKANEEKDLSELEKANKRVKELEDQNRLRDAKEAGVEALTKAGAKSPDLLWKTLQGDLEFDDKGKIKNLDTLVTSIKTDHPDQFGTEKPDETIDGGAGGGKKTALTMEQVKKMTPEQINENWDAVQGVMKAGK